MVTQINELRVIMDTSSYEAGAKTIVTASAQAETAQKSLTATVQDSSVKISQAGDWVEKLKRKYVDGYASTQQFTRELNSIARAVDQGRLKGVELSSALDGVYKRYGMVADAAQFAAKSQIEMARATEMANQRFQQQRSITPANMNRQNDPMRGFNGMNPANIAAQFQDIAVTAAMGMNPLQIALQQGTQLSAVLGPMGAAGAVRSLGAAFVSLINPVSLVTVGLVAAAAAALQYLGPLIFEGDKAEETLKAQRDLIADVVSKWGDALPALKAYNDEQQRGQDIIKQHQAVAAAVSMTWDDARKQIADFNVDVADAISKIGLAGADQDMISVQNVWNNLVTRVQSGKATFEDVRNAQTTLNLVLHQQGIEVEGLSGMWANLMKIVEDASGRSRQLMGDLNNPLAQNEALLKQMQPYGDAMLKLQEYYRSQYNPVPVMPNGIPVPTPRPKVELEGHPDAKGATADIVSQIQARQQLMRTQQDDIERMRLESRLVGASAKERAGMLAALAAEQQLRQQGISALSAEGRAYIANAQAIAVARIETERLNQLSVSRDPAGERSNVAAQVQARQSLWQAQADQMEALKVESQAIGASTKERAVMMAALQAEQALRRQGISALSEEGKAYIDNAKAMAEARVEVERQNQLMLSRDPAGQRSNIADQVQARQQLAQAQQDEMEKLLLGSRLIGASTKERAVLTAALSAELQLRQQGISALSAEGRAYIANAQAIAAARVEMERMNQLSLSRDPTGERANTVAQVQARQSLWQSQKDQADALNLESALIGASTKDRAVMMAAMQAEQTLRNQGISVLSAEGRAYVENAKTMAAARAEIERQNQVALSRDPSGERSNIVERIKTQQQLAQTQADQIEQLQLEAELVGKTASERARATAALQAEQQLRQQGINILSQEGQAYRDNAVAMAEARVQIERSQAAYASYQQAGSSAIDALTASTGTLQDRLKNAANAMLSWVTQMALANPLKNALFGTNLPTLADLGKPQVPAGLTPTSTASMMVTAGTVMINGGVMGGQFPSIPGTVPGATTTNGTLSSVLGIPANTNGVRPDLMPGGLVNSPVAANQNVPAGSIEAYIRQSAIARGINPDTAVAVARSEGGLQSWNLQSQVYKNGIQEPSYGPFQLLKGGSGTGFPTGLGNQFQSQTGLDPSQAANGPQGVDFALDYASKNGWSSWYGAKASGISRWEGIGKNPGIDSTTTNSISQSTNALKQFSSTTASASKDVGTLGDTTSKLGTQLTDNLGKLATPAATPAVPAVAPATTTASGGNIFSSLFGGIFKLFGFADGTPFSPGGVAMVGERGPELVNLPRGSQVIPNHRMGDAIGGSAGSRGPVNMNHTYNITVSGNGDSELLERMRVVAEDSARAGVAAYDQLLPDRIEAYRMNPSNRGGLAA